METPKEITYAFYVESGQPLFESKGMLVKGRMPLEGLLKLGFGVRVLKEVNRLECSNNSYKIHKVAWVMRLQQINNFFLSLCFFFSNFFSFLFSFFLVFLDGIIWFELSLLFQLMILISPMTHSHSLVSLNVVMKEANSFQDPGGFKW